MENRNEDKISVEYRVRLCVEPYFRLYHIKQDFWTDTNNSMEQSPS
jgi:hypothetical protein